MDGLNSTEGIVALAGAALGLIALVLAIVLAVKLRRLRAAQRRCWATPASSTWSSTPPRLEQGFVALRDWVEETAQGIETRMGSAEDRIDGCVTYRSLIRYDAYGEMSGRQSSSIALLDSHQLGRGHVLDPAPRERARVRQAGARGQLGAGALARGAGGRGRGPGAAPAGAGRPHVTSVAYLGPPGTHTEEALLASAPGPVEREPRATLLETVMAVQQGETDRAVVPIENSLEGGVAATLDALAGPADGVRIVAEVVHQIHHNLIARPGTALGDVRKVLSIPHATGQCVRFLDASLPGAERLAVASTAEAVRVVSRSDEPWAALGSALAAELYGCEVLAADVEDRDDNQTRFVWLAPAADAEPPTAGAATTSIVFWGFNDESPGALVSVLGRALQPRHQPDPDRVAPAPGAARALHVLRRPGRLDRRPARGRGAGRAEARVHELRLLGSYPSGPGRGPR